MHTAAVDHKRINASIKRLITQTICVDEGVIRRGLVGGFYFRVRLEGLIEVGLALRYVHVTFTSITHRIVRPNKI
jgi:hypothetical protein